MGNKYINLVNRKFTFRTINGKMRRGKNSNIGMDSILFWERKVKRLIVYSQNSK